MSKYKEAWVQRLHDKIVAAATLEGGYLSMETAPRDGTHILIKCIVSLYDKRYGDYLPVGCKWEEFRFVGDKFEVWTGTEDGYQVGGGGEPIGWAPLPFSDVLAPADGAGVTPSPGKRGKSPARAAVSTGPRKTVDIGKEVLILETKDSRGVDLWVSDWDGVFMLDSGSDRAGFKVYDMLPRAYKTERGARQAAALLTEEKLTWTKP